MQKFLHKTSSLHESSIKQKSRKRIIFKCLVFFLTILIINAKAATKTWTGATSTDWSTAGNWSPSGVPASGDRADIPGGLSRYPIINGTVLIGILNINYTTGS